MTLPWGKITDTDANSLSTLKNEDMVEHLRNMKELCRALHSDKDYRDMIVLRELLEGVLEHIISLPAQERDLDLKGKILNDFYLLLERCEKRFFVKYSRHHAFSFFRLQRNLSNFRNLFSKHHSPFLHTNLKTPPLLSSSFEQIRVDRVRELLEALREDLQQLRPPPWAITLHRKVAQTSILFWGDPYSIHHPFGGPEVQADNTKLFSQTCSST